MRQESIPAAGARLVAWLQALRLPFYPMSWMAYTAGASLAMPLHAVWQQPAYWLGYAVIFALEAITVFLNDIHDYETDRRNANHSSFTGGSRVLVEQRLSVADLRRGCVVAACIAAVACGFLAGTSPAPLWASLACLAAGAFLGIGYTVPPLKFSHRSLGEVVVAFTHGLLLVQTGALLLGGPLGSSAIWQVGLPLFFAILPSITLSGLPDRQADAAAGKVTLAVRFGHRPVLGFSVAMTVAAVVLAVAFASRWPAWAHAAIAVHGLLLTALIAREWRHADGRRVDALMATSLSFLTWFAIIPLFFRS